MNSICNSRKYSICDMCSRKNTRYCSECMYKFHPECIIRSFYDNYKSAIYENKFKSEGEKKVEDYKVRFKKEYNELKDKYDKLDAMTVKYEAGTLNFTPSCSLELLLEQKKHMGNYIRVLKIRAEIEKIEL